VTCRTEAQVRAAATALFAADPQPLTQAQADYVAALLHQPAARDAA